MKLPAHNSYFPERFHGMPVPATNGEMFDTGLQPKLENGSDPVDMNSIQMAGRNPFRFGSQPSTEATFDFNNPAIPSPFGSSRRMESATNGHASNITAQPSSQHHGPLSMDEIKQLQSIAFPSTSPNGHTSIDARGCGSSSSPDPMPCNGENPKKRKSSTEDDNGDSPPGLDQSNAPVKKTAHNMIEKRYRTNLNDKIAALRDSVPSLRVMSKGSAADGAGDEAEDLEGLTPAHKLNKATVLSKATEYINHLEKRNKKLNDEINALKVRLQASEKLILTGAMTINPSVRSPHSDVSQAGVHHGQQVLSPSTTGPAIDPTSGARIQSVTEGMIQVPESMRRLHAAQAQQQPHYESRHTTYPLYNQARAIAPEMAFGAARRSNAFMSKLMVGSLAGLMIVEGFSVRNQHSAKHSEPDKGLSAVPLHSLRYVSRSLGPASPFDDMTGRAGLYTMAKAGLIIFCLLYVFSSLIADFSKKKPKVANPFPRLAAAPSLAAPVEVRRKAWLTAIQTVWVPRHSFLLEAAALGLKMLKLSIRKLIGWDGYALLTGTTKDHEAARVKAWEIALDAQLTGGDAEISKSRLLLTLMASGTLPSTPARLMLKALHIRVFLWEVANAGYGSWYLFEKATAQLARRYWNAAKREHDLLKHAPHKSDSSTETLPSHLATLLEHDCDDILVDTIIQRAYNLAWNRPSAEDTQSEGTMDSVVEDFSIASPLDALAAWWSSLVLNKVVLDFLEHSDADNKELSPELELAVRSAPPGSSASARALAAKALLDDAHRDLNIPAACEALPISPPSPAPAPSSTSISTPLVNLVSETPISFDVRISLTFAKCLWLASDIAKLSSKARSSAIAMVNRTRIPFTQCSLLSVVAGIHLLRTFRRDPMLLAETRPGLENLAYALRLWIGRTACRKSGLSEAARSRLVSECIQVGKQVAGIHEVIVEEDDGYVSASDSESDSPSRQTLCHSEQRRSDGCLVKSDFRGWK
ncbi:MAG: hypothetical protein M1821_006280 [Bathelium mastoideum]|nr:MAG: hypothetical protein M1821_006280 [Bathelium mastoideum]